MSCDIRRYGGGSMVSESPMALTAFVGKGHSVQFSINGEFCCLNESELCDLISTVARRINCEEGYTATGTEREALEYKG